MHNRVHFFNWHLWKETHGQSSKDGIEQKTALKNGKVYPEVEDADDRYEALLQFAEKLAGDVLATNQKRKTIAIIFGNIKDVSCITSMGIKI